MRAAIKHRIKKYFEKHFLNSWKELINREKLKTEKTWSYFSRLKKSKKSQEKSKINREKRKTIKQKIYIKKILKIIASHSTAIKRSTFEKIFINPLQWEDPKHNNIASSFPTSPLIDH